MCERLSNTLSSEDLQENPYACNALFEIVRTAFYPTWQRSLVTRPVDLAGHYTNEDRSLWNSIAIELRNVWKDKTFELCRDVGEEMGIPGWIINLVMDYVANHIWNLVWDITGTFYST